MSNIQFEIGDKVKVNPQSKFARSGQWSDGIPMRGEIVYKDGEWWGVKWPGGNSYAQTNTYRTKDLIFNPTIKELRDKKLRAILNEV